MLQTKTVTKDELASRLRARKGGRKHKSDTNQRAAGSAVNEVIMHKHDVDVKYLKGLQALIDRVAEDQTRALVESGEAEKRGVTVAYESGRVFDKVLIGMVNKDRTTEPLVVRYFVSRETGVIYGAKSELAPNKRWYFGTLDTAGLWDWSGDHAVPKDAEKAGVTEVGSYGEYKHFQPIAVTA
jgi:hypothetical protein